MNVSGTNKSSKTDWAKLDEMPDETVDASESPELDDDFERAAVRLPEPVSATEIDPDVLAWFEAQGNTSKRLNAALRIYAEAHRKIL